MSKLNNPWFMLGAAVVGLVTAAGVLITEYIKQEQKRQCMAQDLAQLDKTVMRLKRQLEQLQNLHSTENGRLKQKSRKRMSSAMSTTTSEDYNSAIDSSDMEFFDISDEEDNSRASTITSLENALSTVDERLESGSLEEVAAVGKMLEELYEDYHNSPDLLLRMANVQYKYTFFIKDVTELLEHVQTGLDFCEKALKLNPDFGECHKLKAMLLGSRCPHLSMRQKVNESIEFKNHLDTAMGLMPNDPMVHHLLGRYYLEVAGLKWYERQAASVFFQELPSASYEDALHEFVLAEDLDCKPWKQNTLCLAKCYIALENISTAVSYLQKASMIEPTKHEGEELDEEIWQLLQKYDN